MYTSFYGDEDVEWSYSEGVVSVSVKEFETYAVPIFDDMKKTMRKAVTLG